MRTIVLSICCLLLLTPLLSACPPGVQANFQSSAVSGCNQQQPQFMSNYNQQTMFAPAIVQPQFSFQSSFSSGGNFGVQPQFGFNSFGSREFIRTGGGFGSSPAIVVRRGFLGRRSFAIFP